MKMNHKYVNAPVGLVILLLVFSGCASRTPADETSVRRTVREFGKELQQVSLSGDRETAVREIETHYGKFVSPSLLEEWTADPSAAPGRLTSSPWPDRIEIDSVRAVSGAEYRVTGRIMEMTSVEVSGHLPGTPTPVEMTLAKQDGRWLITRYASKAPQATIPPTEDAGGGRTEAPDSSAAVSVLETYYDAINEKDYARAYALWDAEGQASGKTLAQFSAGFAKTESSKLTVGEPGQVGAAAGSRYIDVPVTINARLSDGAEQYFSGTYTLRRSVVDGATPEQRQWRIYKASISRQKD